MGSNDILWRCSHCVHLSALNLRYLEQEQCTTMHQCYSMRKEFMKMKVRLLKYIKIAVENGIVSSTYNYVAMISKGEGVRIDKGEILKQCSTMASGWSEAMIIKYIKMASDQGYGRYFCNHAILLYYNEDLERNLEEEEKKDQKRADRNCSRILY